MDTLLESHALSADLLRSDIFEDFLEDRRRQLCDLISDAMGKPVTVGVGSADVVA